MCRAPPVEACSQKKRKEESLAPGSPGRILWTLPLLITGMPYFHLHGTDGNAPLIIGQRQRRDSRRFSRSAVEPDRSKMLLNPLPLSKAAGLSQRGNVEYAIGPLDPLWITFTANECKFISCCPALRLPPWCVGHLLSAGFSKRTAGWFQRISPAAWIYGFHTNM